MSIFSTMSVQEYIGSLSLFQVTELEPLLSMPSFDKFLSDPNYDDAIDTYKFVVACEEANIPEEYTKTSSSLHYLALAIKDRLG